MIAYLDIKTLCVHWGRRWSAGDEDPAQDLAGIQWIEAGQRGELPRRQTVSSASDFVTTLDGYGIPADRFTNPVPVAENDTIRHTRYLKTRMLLFSHAFLFFLNSLEGGAAISIAASRVQIRIVRTLRLSEDRAHRDCRESETNL